MDTSTLRQAGYAITGTAEGGDYVFTDLAELDKIIGDWEALRDRIKDRYDKFAHAIGLIEPPAEDIMSRLQAATATYSLEQAQSHSQTMYLYASGYVEKLHAARVRYTATEADNIGRLGKAGP